MHEIYSESKKPTLKNIHIKYLYICLYIYIWIFYEKDEKEKKIIYCITIKYDFLCN